MDYLDGDTEHSSFTATSLDVAPMMKTKKIIWAGSDINVVISVVKFVATGKYIKWDPLVLAGIHGE